jgi:Na+-translocating ferredoxin:NAD+ oxidoreductase RnfA subunit
MTNGTGFIGASLIALVVERFILERYLGRKSLSTTSGRFAQTGASAMAVASMLIVASAGAGLLSGTVLLPVGATYLYAPVFIMVIMLCGLAGQMLFSSWRPRIALNGEFGKAVVIGSMIGYLTLVPQSGDFSLELSLARTVAHAAEAGGVFFLVKLLYCAIQEKSDFAKAATGGLLYARELATMGLLALVLKGISNVHLFK